MPRFFGKFQLRYFWVLLSLLSKVEEGFIVERILERVFNSIGIKDFIKSIKRKRGLRLLEVHLKELWWWTEKHFKYLHSPLFLFSVGSCQLTVNKQADSVCQLRSVFLTIENKSFSPLLDTIFLICIWIQMCLTILTTFLK